jgi:hypothetical protein
MQLNQAPRSVEASRTPWSAVAERSGDTAFGEVDSPPADKITPRQRPKLHSPFGEQSFAPLRPACSVCFASFASFASFAFFAFFAVNPNASFRRHPESHHAVSA